MGHVSRYIQPRYNSPWEINKKQTLTKPGLRIRCLDGSGCLAALLLYYIIWFVSAEPVFGKNACFAQQTGCAVRDSLCRSLVP